MNEKSREGAARKKEIESLAIVLQDIVVVLPANAESETSGPPILADEILTGPPLKAWQHPYPL
jgi:hypothetical protein